MSEVSNNGFRGISFGVKAVLVTLVPVAGLGVMKLLFWLITNPRIFLYLWGVALAIGLLSEHYIREWRNNIGGSNHENRTVVVTAITEEPGTNTQENPVVDQTDVIAPEDNLNHRKKPEVSFLPEEKQSIPVRKVSTKVISLVQTVKTDDDSLPKKDLSQATARTLDLESFLNPMITDEGNSANSNKKGALKVAPIDVNKNYAQETEWGSINSPQSEVNIIFSGISNIKDDESTYAMKS